MRLADAAIAIHHLRNQARIVLAGDPKQLGTIYTQPFPHVHEGLKSNLAFA
jgi:hypothetical protein